MHYLGGVATLVLLFCAVLLWAASLDQIDLQKMDDTGLISVLPYSVIFSLHSLADELWPCHLPTPLVTAACAASHRSPHIYALWHHRHRAGGPRFAIGWKLAGIIDYIIQTGTVDGRIDAFFNWPTVFVLMAFVTEITGVDSAVSFMAWAPVFFNLLYLAPLWMIFRSATTDKRLVFLGLWFFFLANWIGQDYLSPQAFNYFFYLVILAIILTFLRGEAWPASAALATLRARSTYLDRTARWIEKRVSGNENPVAPTTPSQRAALVVLLVLLCMVMVSGHQLTPFATLGAISALVIFNRCTVLTLPILLGVLIATWVIFMATPYLSGHIHHVAAPVGSVGTNIDANLTERFRGSPGHIFVNYMRTGMSLFVWGLAFLGMLRRFLNGYRDRSLLVIAMTPFPLLLLQAYGGELLLRIYLYSVPFMVYFAAALFFPAPYAGHRLLSQVTLYSISVLLIVGFFITRYGNERMTYFTAGEVEAVQYLYEHAEPGSQLIAATGTLPWRYQDYRSYKYTTVPGIARDSDIEELIGIMADRKYPASYLILTRSQQASGELFIGWMPGTWEQFEEMLAASGRFYTLYANEDASVLGLIKACSEQDVDGRLCRAKEKETKREERLAPKRGRKRLANVAAPVTVQEGLSTDENNAVENNAVVSNEGHKSHGCLYLFISP